MSNPYPYNSDEYWKFQQGVNQAMRGYTYGPDTDPVVRSGIVAAERIKTSMVHAGDDK